MAASADIYFEHDRWGRALAWSAGLHVGVTAAIIIWTIFFAGPSGAGWGAGGGGKAIGATLVSSVPIPRMPSPTQNVLANESKGLTESQPKQIEEAPDAIPIPGKKTKIKPKKEPTPTKQMAKNEPPPETNQIPYGEGGPVSGPYGSFDAGGAKGGFGFTGGGGDFGTMFAWYVRVVQQKVSEDWLKYEVDPNIKDANRVYVTFDIARDGHPSNVRIEQSSGVPSLDNSALNAVRRIDTFGPLPQEYSGNKVSVEFWFDYKK